MNEVELFQGRREAAVVDLQRKGLVPLNELVEYWSRQRFQALDQKEPLRLQAHGGLHENVAYEVVLVLTLLASMDVCCVLRWLLLQVAAVVRQHEPTAASAPKTLLATSLGRSYGRLGWVSMVRSSLGS